MFDGRPDGAGGSRRCGDLGRGREYIAPARAWRVQFGTPGLPGNFVRVGRRLVISCTAPERAGKWSGKVFASEMAADGDAPSE